MMRAFPDSDERQAQMAILEDRVAIVTGSARGIGRATAELLAEHGAKVLINDLDADVAEQAASEIQGETAVFGGDLTQEGVCDELVQGVIDRWGKVDILVNNAGYTLDAPLHKLSDDWFARMIDIHLVAPFRMCRAVAPHMREPAKVERAEGREVFRKIVNVSSISREVCSATSPSRSLIRTFAPCSARSSAVARPMPRAEPVTIATLSSSTAI